jgi:electron transfer flavoprotein alpha subunit
VFAEQYGGDLSETPLELLGKAAELRARSGEEVTAVLLGDGVAALADKLLRYGADRVLLAEHRTLAEYKTRPYTAALSTLVEKHKPSVFLFGATSLGRDLAPRVMARLGTGLTADCLDLDIGTDGVLIQTKPSYGGNILCTITVPERRPQMATVRPHVFPTPVPAERAQGEIVCETLDVPADNDYETLERRPRVCAGIPLDKANVIVAGGRGVKTKEDLDMLAELARLLGGRVACSRPLVDCGWMTHDDQVGQSGNTVKPAFILNVGISGSAQYLAGMQNASCVASINHDDNADILGVSHFAAVAEYQELIPAVIAELKRIQQLSYTDIQ